jgi:hypothetical protein
MAFDSDRNRTVLFGGRSTANNFFGDTWEWDGSFWTQIEDIGPAPRFLSALVYDTARKVCLLFGGKDSTQQLGDTWQWDGIKWTKLSDSGPPGRSSHAMAFDSNRSRTVLFAGQTPANLAFADTWEFDGDNWTQQQDAGPPPRAAHAMAFDDLNHRTVLFGGLDGAANSLGDTWAWDGLEWVQIAEFGPSPRLETTLASNQDGGLILYGGLSTVFGGPTHQILSDSWEFDGKRWTQRQDIGPGPLHEAAIAFDSLRARVVLFGGITTAPDGSTPATGNTWELPAASVRVASISIPSSVIGGTHVVFAVNLSRPAPAGGVIVNFNGSIFATNGANMAPITVDPGTKAVAAVAAFAPTGTPTTATFSAEIEGTPPVSATVKVLP